MQSKKDLLLKRADLLKEAKDPGCSETRFEEIKAAVANTDRQIERLDFLREAEAATAAPAQDPETLAAEEAKKAGKPGVFKSLGEQLVAAVNATRGHLDPRLFKAAASGASEGVASDGGFLVQTDFAAGILTKTHAGGEILSRVRKVTISGPSNGIKINAVNETSRANGSRWGGVRGYWVGEAGSPTASKPTFRQVKLELSKLVGLMYATDELLQDAAALGSIISEALPEELRFLVEDAIINGSGAGQPLGILNSGAVVEVAKESGQAAATVKTENVLKMDARGYVPSRTSAVWLCNQDVLPQFPLMTVGGSSVAVPVYQPAGGLSGSQFSTLLGRPVIPVEYCATLGTAGDLLNVDLGQYLLADKGGIESASSMHVQFLTGEMAFRFTYRVDGQPLWNSALTPFKGSNTVSPYVSLATRS